MNYEPFRDLKDLLELEKTPLEQRISTRSTYELVQKAAALNPNRAAISFINSSQQWDQPRRVTYSDFLHEINLTANLLADLGIKPNDVVSYMLPNIPEVHSIIYGSEAAGIAGPINHLLEPHQILEIMQAAKSKVLFLPGNAPWQDVVKKFESIRPSLPDLKAIIKVGGEGNEKDGIYSFEEMKRKYPADRLTFRRDIQPDDVCSMYHTGGTTGTPKLAQRTHFNEIFIAWTLAFGMSLTPEDAMMCGLPLFHANGTMVTGIAPFSVGASVVLLGETGYRDQAIMENFWNIVAFYRATCFAAVPTILSVLLKLPKPRVDISSLRFALCGAAPLPIQVFHDFEAYTGMRILEGYGLTEGTAVSTFNPRDGIRKIGSIGLRTPYQQVKTVILDEEGKYLRDCQTDEIGVVVIKGPNVMKGYVEERHNKGLFVQPGWMNTGDMGRQDSSGYFWLTGRKKELIIRGGHNIDPATIEETLYKIPEVELAAAVGRPDSHAGEVPVAYVQLKPGANLTEEQILAHCQKTIGERAAIPKAIHIIAKIPLSAVGKIFKPALRYDGIKRVYHSELEVLAPMIKGLKLEVKEDKVYGTLALIEIQPSSPQLKEKIEKTIKESLGKFSVHYQIFFQE